MTGGSVLLGAVGVFPPSGAEKAVLRINSFIRN